MRAFSINLVAAALVLAGSMAAVAQPAALKASKFSPSQLVGQCIDIYQDWSTQGTPRAFALSEDGMDCGASWNHATAEEARTDALAQCRQTGANGCAIVTEDTTPPVTVTVGDVVLIRACAVDYQNWVEQVAPKSFYATEDGTSCGAAWGYETLRQSSKEARRLCQEYGIPCIEIDAAE